VVLFWLLPPTLRANHIESAIAIDVADAQAMRKPKGPGDLLARRARNTDGMHLPGLGWIFAGRKPRHLPFMVLAFGLSTHDQDAFAVLEKINIERRFVTSAVPNHMFFPIAALATRVLVPMTRSSREADDDQIGPAVSVDVLGPTSETLAIDVLVAVAIVVFA